jgi:hypothetical protein
LLIIFLGVGDAAEQQLVAALRERGTIAPAPRLTVERGDFR